MIYKCYDCEQGFDEPDSKLVIEGHNWGGTDNITQNEYEDICPNCGSTNFWEINHCIYCGEEIMDDISICNKCKQEIAEESKVEKHKNVHPIFAGILNLFERVR